MNANKNQIFKIITRLTLILPIVIYLFLSTSLWVINTDLKANTEGVLVKVVLKGDQIYIEDISRKTGESLWVKDKDIVRTTDGYLKIKVVDETLQSADSVKLVRINKIQVMLETPSSIIIGIVLLLIGIAIFLIPFMMEQDDKKRIFWKRMKIGYLFILSLSIVLTSGLIPQIILIGTISFAAYILEIICFEYYQVKHNTN